MSDKQPLVSILIPVYNREILLKPCIESALAQTYENTEIIVVDNQSTDGTWDLCREYAAKYPKVKVYRNEENLGPVGNWLSCMNHASGELGKILFSDDLMYEMYLEKTVPCLNENVGLVFSSVEIGPERGLGIASYRYMDHTGQIESRKFLVSCLMDKFGLVSPGAALFRLADLRKNLCYGDKVIPSPTIHDFDRHGAGPDLLLYLLTAGQYENVAFVDEVLGLFRSHEGSISIQDKKQQYLGKCYYQAKIVYAEEHMPELAEKIMNRKWLAEIKKNKSWQGFQRFCQAYTERPDSYKLRYGFLLRMVKDKLMGKNKNGESK